MPPNYTPEFKKKIVRLRKEEGRTIKSITAEYGVSKKSGGILCKGNRFESYLFIDQHKKIFGIRWLLHRLKYTQTLITII